MYSCRIASIFTGILVAAAALTAIIYLGVHTSNKPPRDILLNKERATYCRTPSGSDEHFNVTTFNHNLDAWHRGFGRGAGTLKEGIGHAPTYQGVCCEGWCLWAVRAYVAGERSWTDEDFAAAVEEIGHYGPGRDGCGTELSERDSYVYLNFMRDSWQIWKETGASHGQAIFVGQEFGDTCQGAKPYIGPA